MEYKPGEHPLADILQYHISTYGELADIFIRGIRDYIGLEKTFAWWEKEIGRDGDAEDALDKAETKIGELQDAERRGKGIPEIYSMDEYRASGEEN